MQTLDRKDAARDTNSRRFLNNVMRAAYSSSTVAYSIWRPVLNPSGGRGCGSDFGARSVSLKVETPLNRVTRSKDAFKAAPRLAMRLAGSHMTVKPGGIRPGA
jgi:hypothetical protein